MKAYGVIVFCAVVLLLSYWLMVWMWKWRSRAMGIMTRTFHPVGQGAFYTEKFDFGFGCKLNIVYDCGTLAQCGFKDMQRVVDEAFAKDEQIDGVFISHFDSDHANGFPMLFRRVGQRVGHIFLPHLTDRDVLVNLVAKRFDAKEIEYAKAYLEFRDAGDGTNMFDCLGIGARRENGPRIHLVGGEEERDGANKQDRGYDRVKSGEDVASRFFGVSLPTGGVVSFWRYIPFNFDTRNGTKRNAFEKSIDDYLRGRSIKEVLNSQASLEELKRRYDKDVPGDINGNSMTLLSCARAPWLDGLASYCHCESALGQGRRIMRCGCLYTGDYNTKGRRRWESLWRTYAPYIGEVGCVQLPHHGSDGNYNDLLGELDAVFVACYGKRNTFQHPGPRTMYHLGMKRRTTILVTEDDKSRFVQVMRFPFPV